MVRRAPHRDALLRTSGVERHFPENELIVTKTDLKGHITYANPLFVDLAGYPYAQILGAPHCLIRHPDMPASVFKLLWDTIQAEKEIFAYVVNRSANGDHYWVFAHVTPSYDSSGKLNGYHSNRRKPSPSVVKQVIIPLYDKLRRVEATQEHPKAKCQAGVEALTTILNEQGKTYEEFIFSLGH